MMKGAIKKKIIKGLIIFISAWAIIIYEPKSAPGQPPADWVAGMAYDIAPSAKITKISFYLGKTQAGEMLIYEIGIKNVAAKPIRFKLTIYPLPGDPVSGFYPLTAKKGKPIALMPNEELISRWPVFSQEFPRGFALVVKEVED